MSELDMATWSGILEIEQSVRRVDLLHILSVSKQQSMVRSLAHVSLGKQVEFSSE